MTVPAASVSAAVAQTVWGVLGYTRWPGDPSPVQLCLVGKPPTLRCWLRSELPGGRRLQTRRISPDDAQPLNACHGVCRPSAPRPVAAADGGLAWGQPLLTISEVAADCATEACSVWTSRRRASVSS
jgi:hypothetical protein